MYLPKSFCQRVGLVLVPHPRKHAFDVAAYFSFLAGMIELGFRPHNSRRQAPNRSRNSANQRRPAIAPENVIFNVFNILKPYEGG